MGDNRPASPSPSEKKHEERWDILFISRGQDIGEEVLTYFRNRTKRSENSNGHAQKGMIMSAFGQVLNPILENSSASDEGSCSINSLGGTFIISEDGEFQQSGPLTISYFRPNWGVSEGRVSRLVAAGPVQVVVAWQLSI